MSLALAELLIDSTLWSKEVIADKFVECFKRDIRKGYSRRFFDFLQSIETGKEFLLKVNTQSTRNGAAMRSAPIGIVSDIDELLAMAKMQASLTHNTEIGIKSAQAVSLAAHYFIYNKGSKSSLSEYVSDFTKYQWNDNWQSQVACCGIETVNALLTVLKKSSSLKEVLTKSIDFGGDVDTVAALGLGIASLSKEYESELSDFLYDDLENGVYGRDYLKHIGRELMKLKKN